MASVLQFPACVTELGILTFAEPRGIAPFRFAEL